MFGGWTLLIEICVRCEIGLILQLKYCSECHDALLYHMFPSLSGNVDLSTRPTGWGIAPWSRSCVYCASLMHVLQRFREGSDMVIDGGDWANLDHHSSTGVHGFLAPRLQHCLFSIKRVVDRNRRHI